MNYYQFSQETGKNIIILYNQMNLPLPLQIKNFILSYTGYSGIALKQLDNNSLGF